MLTTVVVGQSNYFGFGFTILKNNRFITFACVVHSRLNRLEKAVSSYNDALRIDPFFVEAYNGRGNALMDFGHEDGTVLGR